MDSYGAIYSIYDKINEDIDYARWADFIEDCFTRFAQEKPSLVLDLACGTGRMTEELSARGYDMIGVDGSSDMLGIAYSKNPGGILYLLQDMRDFELYGTVSAVVCCLDSINYLTEDGDIARCFSTVHNYLDPNGLFIFDVNTPYKFEEIYGTNAYVFDESIGGRKIYCGWQNSYDKESRICDFYLSVFEESKSGYRRYDETQFERCYNKDELLSALESAGFELCGYFGDFEYNTPDAECQRWYIVARAVKS